MLGERQPSNRESSDLLKKSAEELNGRSADKSAGRMGKGSTSSHEEDLLENDDEGKLKGNRKKRWKSSFRARISSLLSLSVCTEFSEFKAYYENTCLRGFFCSEACVQALSFYFS